MDYKSKEINEQIKLFLRYRQCQVLMMLNNELKPKYTILLSRELNYPLSTVNKIVENLVYSGYVKKEKEDRKQILTITPKGREVAEHINNLYLIFRSLNNG